jgi:hypothetical protein
MTGEGKAGCLVPGAIGASDASVARMRDGGAAMSMGRAGRGALFAAVVATAAVAAAPAQADWRGRPGWGYGPPPRAYHPPPAYRGGYYPGAGLALGAIVGLGIGAAIASQPYYAPPPPPPIYSAPPPPVVFVPPPVVYAPPPVVYAPPPAVVYGAPGWAGPAKSRW